jgi:ADP-heptose:LPS heptosyltransferase
MRQRSRPESPRILLVRLRLIGDVIFTTPIVAALRHTFPDAHLTYLVEPDAAAVVSGNPHLDDVIVAPRHRGLRRLTHDAALAARLRRGRYDIAIDMHGGPRGAWLAWASGAPMRVGYTIAGRSWMYTHLVARAPDLTPRHSVENQWDLLAPLGFGAADAERYPVEMTPDADAEARVAGRLDAAGIGPTEPLVAVHVSANNPFRRWPADSFAAVIVDLVRRDPRRRIAVFSGPSDAAAAARVAADARARLGDAAGAVPDLGGFDVAEIRALASRAAVYIGGDSGPMHIAATTAVPIVAIVGPTLAERSRPWRRQGAFAEVLDGGPLPCRPCHQRHCVPGDFRCLTGVGAGRVLDAAERGMQHG